MREFVGLDVSLKETNVCILDGVGQVIFEGKAASDPAAIAALISAKTMQLTVNNAQRVDPVGFRGLVK